MSQVAHVSYTYNSHREEIGLPSYSLTAYVSRDGRPLVQVDSEYATRQEFFDAINAIIPVISEAQDLQEFQ